MLTERFFQLIFVFSVSKSKQKQFVASATTLPLICTTPLWISLAFFFALRASFSALIFVYVLAPVCYDISGCTFRNQYYILYIYIACKSIVAIQTLLDNLIMIFIRFLCDLEHWIVFYVHIWMDMYNILIYWAHSTLPFDDSTTLSEPRVIVLRINLKWSECVFCVVCVCICITFFYRFNVIRFENSQMEVYHFTLIVAHYFVLTLLLLLLLLLRSIHTYRQ